MKRRETNMKRREVLKSGGAVAAAAAAASFSAPAIAQGKKELKMVTSWPANFPGLGTAAVRIGKRIEEMSAGKYKVKVFAGGELVHPLKVNDAVEEGAAELYHSADYYFQGKSKAYNFFSTVPLGMTASEMLGWVYWSDGRKLWDELAANFNVKPLLCGNTGVQMGGWYRKQMRTVEDFKGLKMRIPGLGGAVVTGLGGTSVTLAGGDIFPALQAGTIDATEWVGPWNDLAFGFYKVAKYCYYPGFHEPATTLSMGVNKKLWDSMPRSDQAMFEAACAAETTINIAEYHTFNSRSLDTLINVHKVDFREFSDDIFKAVAKTAQQVVADVGKTDAITKKVYDSYMKHYQLAKGWSYFGEQMYMNKRWLST
ncbi:MAG: TRAP transporter substrate-binding protein [Acidiferrobacterales bacterium]